MTIEITMYLLFLAVGFGLGVVVSLNVSAQRLEKKMQRLSEPVPPPHIEINVSEELVARYLDSFDLVAIPKDLVVRAGQAPTRH
ncbi:hypothetical protein [Methylococcus geothermalis]|uniref:Transmembrane protein n=1 Tax=Methylococcus geothermalis TaxID=2681310 RepID=A0A858Q4M4_9GAMM|nr:hypothetical protein [Methylococcus geothermalis]QJD28792.1 hypothetical protein GNH96_01650 [Methylococcus geothermalis]